MFKNSKSNFIRLVYKNVSDQFEFLQQAMLYINPYNQVKYIVIAIMQLALSQVLIKEIVPYNLLKWSVCMHLILYATYQPYFETENVTK